MRETKYSAEKAKLLKMLFSNCFVDAVSVIPTCRKLFDMIFKRVHSGEWSALVDDFRTFQAVGFAIEPGDPF